MITQLRSEATLERGRLLVVIINVVAVSLLTFAPWSDWRTGAALNLVDNCLLVGSQSLSATHCWRDFFSSEL
jgi:hypothetical protein